MIRTGNVLAACALLAGCSQLKIAPELDGASSGGFLVDSSVASSPGSVPAGSDAAGGPPGQGGPAPAFRADGGAGELDGPSGVGTCREGERRCGVDQRPETCSASGDWVGGDACPFACLGQGECGGECRPDSKRCAGERGLAPQTCDRSGRWMDSGAPCANLCSSGSCGGSCMPGAVRCGGSQTPETCSPMGTWEPGKSCAYVCLGAGQCTGECKPGSKKCLDGHTPAVCDDSGAWKPGAECRDNFACSAGACSAKICVPGFKYCQSAGSCIPASGCCTNQDCGRCQACAAGRCQNQTPDEDLKNECPDGACRTGKCDGAGSCDVRNAGPDPSGTCQGTCKTGSCAPGGKCQSVPQGQQASGCDGMCQQCNGAGSCSSEASATCFADGDADGFGNRDVSRIACGKCPSGFVSSGTDCDDANASAHPATDASPVTFHPSPRSNGSFDYDCNGGVEKDRTQYVAGCHAKTESFRMPACTADFPIPTPACGTVITDVLLECDFIRPDFDGVCVTDNPNIIVTGSVTVTVGCR
jgi:hypothetical protein